MTTNTLGTKLYVIIVSILTRLIEYGSKLKHELKHINKQLISYLVSKHIIKPTKEGDFLSQSFDIFGARKPNVKETQFIELIN